jgi:hypothetical protein
LVTELARMLENAVTVHFDEFDDTTEHPLICVHGCRKMVITTRGELRGSRSGCNS